MHPKVHLTLGCLFGQLFKSIDWQPAEGREVRGVEVPRRARGRQDEGHLQEDPGTNWTKISLPGKLILSTGWGWWFVSGLG